MRKAFTEYGVKDVFYKENFPKELSKLQKLVATEVENTYLAVKMDEKPKILVVEDEPDWQDMLKDILESEGCEVDIAGSYQDAIEKMMNSSYHLATIDIRLDNINSQDTRGLQFLETVKQIGLTIDSIVISAVASPEQAAWALVELGARDFINKSDFRRERFRRKVRKLLSRTIYFNVSFSEAGLNSSKEVPVLHLGKAYDLVITTSIKRPKSGFTRTISKPTQEGKFELEVVLHPYDVDVLPGSTQYISANLGDSPEPCLYTIVPKILGHVEIVIDFLYRTNPLGRMLIKAESIE
jgi:CheY-like chemotaxis protein